MIFYGIFEILFISAQKMVLFPMSGLIVLVRCHLQSDNIFFHCFIPIIEYLLRVYATAFLLFTGLQTNEWRSAQGFINIFQSI